MAPGAGLQVLATVQSTQVRPDAADPVSARGDAGQSRPIFLLQRNKYAGIGQRVSIGADTAQARHVQAVVAPWAGLISKSAATSRSRSWPFGRDNRRARACPRKEDPLFGQGHAPAYRVCAYSLSIRRFRLVAISHGRFRLDRQAEIGHIAGFFHLVVATGVRRDRPDENT
jgi:hypothetical protein